MTDTAWKGEWSGVMTDSVIVDERPAYAYEEDGERWEVDTKPLRQMQWVMNRYIDHICKGEDTGHEVMNFADLLRNVAQDDFALASLIGHVLGEASSCPDGFRETLHALICVTKTIEQGRCSARQVSWVFSTDYPEKFPK
jgi:hypothetical protein